MLEHAFLMIEAYNPKKISSSINKVRVLRIMGIFFDSQVSVAYLLNEIGTLN